MDTHLNVTGRQSLIKWPYATMKECDHISVKIGDLMKIFVLVISVLIGTVGHGYEKTFTFRCTYDCKPNQRLCCPPEYLGMKSRINKMNKSFGCNATTVSDREFVEAEKAFPGDDYEEHTTHVKSDKCLLLNKSDSDLCPPGTEAKNLDENYKICQKSSQQNNGQPVPSGAR